MPGGSTLLMRPPRMALPKWSASTPAKDPGPGMSCLARTVLSMWSVRTSVSNGPLSGRDIRFSLRSACAWRDAEGTRSFLALTVLWFPSGPRPGKSSMSSRRDLPKMCDAGFVAAVSACGPKEERSGPM